MKAFFGKTNSLLSGIRNLYKRTSYYRFYTYKKDFKKEFSITENYTVKNSNLTYEIIQNCIKEKKYNEALMFYHHSSNKRLFSSLTGKAKNLESFEPILKNKIKESLIKNKNKPIFKHSHLTKVHRAHVNNQRFNFLFLIFIVFIHTNLIDMFLQSGSVLLNYLKVKINRLIGREILEEEHKQDSVNLEKEFQDIFSNFMTTQENNKEFRIAKNLKERLSDVKGMDEVKDEIQEIIHMLKNPAKYEDAGAKLIRGILLVGKPGTGKTLLARALSGESGVNFLFCNASEFEKSLVGQGDRLIKNLFSTARSMQPCIIFIDEIDSLLHKGRRSG